MTSNQRLTATLSFIGLAFVIFAVAFALNHNANPPVPAADEVLFGCEVIDVSEETGHTDDYIALVKSLGYKGDPADPREALYSPGCFDR